MSVSKRVTVAATAATADLPPGAGEAGGPPRAHIIFFFGGVVEDPVGGLDALDLPLHQLVVEPPAGHQLVVGALLHHGAVVDHDDVVRPLHRAEPVGHHQHRVVLHDVVQGLLDLGRGGGVRVCYTVCRVCFK